MNDNDTEEGYEELELWNKIVCNNLRGSVYLKFWNGLPYAIRQNICESFFEYFKTYKFYFARKRNDKKVFCFKIYLKKVIDGLFK